MGNNHGDKWSTALPWVLLGKRVQVQPDLDVSAAQLVFGKALSLPGQMLSHPGKPLTNLQTRHLLEELYRVAARPALPTSTVTNPLDLSHTEKARHVYVKVEDPSGLQPRWEGPYPITSRPSRSTIVLRIGSFVDGRPRLQEYNWNSCKIAHLRDDAPEAERPRLGRRPAANAPAPADKPSIPSDFNRSASSEGPDSTDANNEPQQTNTSGSQPVEPTLSGRPPHPDYIKKGPIITQDMFKKWTPDLLNLPTRPVRSTRNANPRYID